MVSLDESKIIDREAEAEIFNHMLRFETQRRILVVSDKSGTGKSDVLRKLRYLCDYTHEIPVALLDLRELESRPDLFTLVVSLRKGLVVNGATFPTFDAMNNARRDRDRSSLPNRPPSLAGVVRMEGAEVKDSAKVAAKMNIIESAETVYMGQPQWTDDDETEAQSRCVEYFLDDLLELSQKQSAVVLFDTVDKAGYEVQRWIFLELIRKRLLPKRADHKLIVVLAGQGVAEMLSDRLQPPDRECIEPIASLSKWDEHHVAAFLAVHGFTGFKENEIKAIHVLLGADHTLAEALVFAQTLKGMHQQ